MSVRSMSVRSVQTAAAPAPLRGAPYSQAVTAGEFVFVSGIGGIALDGSGVPDTLQDEIELALKNLRAVLEAAGSSPRRLLKVTVFLIDLEDWDTFNDVYGRFVSAPLPARTAVEVSRLPANLRVEVDAIAFRVDGREASSE